MEGPSALWLLVLLGALLLVCVALLLYWLAWLRRPLFLERFDENPVLGPGDNAWESEAVFNPGAVYHDGYVHLFYRALGRDGVSRIGYARSRDGVNFERFARPAFDAGAGFAVPEPMPGVKAQTYRPLSYDTDIYASGGGWGGSEDPRAVIIEGRCYLSFGIFESWQSMRLGITHLSLADLVRAAWRWAPYIPMSPKQETHKNWVLFPEKFNGKFAVLHAMTPEISIEYVDDLESLRTNPIKSNNRRGGRAGRWDAFVRGAAAPPIKTPDGWLLLYHAMNPAGGHGYNVGAMLLDLTDPTKILYRSAYPILTPDAWYEHDWKPGVVYASAAVVVGDDLIVYYGGGDKWVAAAKANLADFLHKLTSGDHAVLTPVQVHSNKN